MARQDMDHRHREQVEDELRETNEKLIKRLAGHRLAEEVLRKDAQTFRAIADTLPVGVSLAEDRKLTWANPAFMKIHGFESANDYFGKSTEILFASHDEFDRVGRIAYSDLQVGNIAEISAKQKRKDGSVFDARLRLALFNASDPAKKIVICCTTDMSEKVEAEDRLRKSDERYRTSLEQSFDGALVLQGSKILFANSGFSEMLGYSKEELEGMEYSEVLHPDYRELVTEKAAARIRGENVPGYYEIKLLRKDGSIFDAEISARVIEMRGEACIQAWVRDISERKNAEEDLRQSEERYRTLVEDSFDGIMIHDGKKVQFANSQYCEMLGYRKEELEGMDVGLTVHPDSWELAKKRIIARMQGEDVPALYELKLRRKDGSALEAETNARAVVLEGRPVIQSWVRDITERKKAEQAHRQSEERYRTLVEESFDGIMVHDGTKITFANSRLCEMLGYRKEELEGMDHLLTVHPDYRELVAPRVAARQRGETVASFYGVKLQRKDGSSFDAEINGRPIDVGGQISSQVWIKDISKRKRAEDAIQQSEERYRTLVEQSFDGIMVHDGTKITFANSLLCEMLGYQRDELEGMDHWLIVHPDNQETVTSRVAARMRGEDVPSRYELKLARKDGTSFDAEINSRVLQAQGAPLIQVWIRDVSEQKKDKEAAHQSEERYRTLVEESFDGIMVHDGKKIVFANSRLCEMLGYQKGELEGIDHRITLHPDCRDMVAERAAARARGEDVPGYYQVKQLRKDGSSFDAEISARLIDVGGERLSQVWIKDISKRKKAEDEARRSEERYRTLVEASFDGIMIHDGTRVLFANSRLCEMIGFTKEEVIGHRFWGAVQDDEKQLVTDRAAARMRGESVPTQYEIKSRRKDGSIFDAEINALKIELDGKPAVQVWMRDISERKKAEEALRESEKKYRTVFDNAAAGINLNLHGRILEANAAFANMLGYSQDEIGQLVFREVTHPDDLEITAQCHEQLVRGERDSCRFQKRYIRKDGRIVWADVWAAAIRNEIGEYQGGISAAIDITDRKQAEEALQRSEANYRAIFDSMNDAIFVHDIETGAIIDVNQKMCEMYGYTREEASRLRAGQMGATEEQHDRELALQRIGLAAQGEPQLFEWQAKTKDGRLFWVEVNLRKAILDDKPCVLAVARDITDRKEAEQERENERQKFRTLVDDAPFGIVMVRKDDTYEYVNPKFIEILGYDLNDIPDGKHWMEKSWPDPEDRRKMMAAWFEDLVDIKKGMIKVRTTAVTCADGTQKMITLRTAQLHTGEFIITCEDITEQIRGEQERKNERQKFRTLVDDAPFGIVMIRKDRTYEYVNPKFTEMLGYDLKDIPDSKNWFKKAWPDPEYRREVIAAWGGDLADLKDGAMKPRTFNVTCHDGTRKMVVFRSAQLHTGEFIMTCEDITEQISGEQERENLRRQLLHAQKMEALGTLVGGVAHDFNNLLTIILGYSELLLIEKQEDDPSAADLKKVIEAASSGASLVQRMLTFSEQTDTILGPLNLNREIENMKELLSRTIPKMISLDLRPSAGLALIDGDAGQIQQVILNLALNAVDAMPDGGKLTIETRNAILDEDYGRTHSGIKPGKYVLLAVSDTGRGMSAQTVQRMYDPFFTTKNRDFTKGTGLGLAIVHGIVQGHGGQIMCSSEPGKGTRFELYFPAISYEELIREEYAEDSTAVAPSAQGAETILLVDDEEMVRDLGARILKKAGYKILTANNGKEALAIYEKEKRKIALVILDLIMPKMGGEQCLEEILKINPKAKILISTGYSSSDEMTRMRIEALASGFVAKPFALTDMLKKVREILDKE